MLKCFFHVLFASTLFTSSVLAQASSLPNNLKHDGVLPIYVYHTDTHINLKYLDNNGQWIPKVYDEINILLRSYTDDKIHPIDKRLIELADHLQDHFQVEQIEVISGFRSPEYNQALKDEGHNVATESYHTKGMAMDIHIDEINETELRDYLESLQLGGVGYYGTKLMVHMDFGPVRTWQDDSFRENLYVGVFNKQLPFHMTTQKFYYADDESVKLGFEKIVTPFSFQNIKLQKFKNGKFETIVNQPQFLNVSPGLVFQIFNWQTKDSRYGKFRFIYQTDTYWQNSNEFYIKRKRM